MKRKYTLYLWETDKDGAFVEIVFPAAVMETGTGEYIIHDHEENDVHYGFPMSTVRYMKEEPIG